MYVTNQRSVWYFLALQQAAVLCIAAVVVCFLGLKAGFSCVVGGMVSVLPNAYFAKMLFKHHGARAARQIVNSVYKGEAMKLLLTVTLFALVFRYVSVNPLIFFASYIAVQMMVWFAPLMMVNERK